MYHAFLLHTPVPSPPACPSHSPLPGICFTVGEDHSTRNSCAHHHAWEAVGGFSPQPDTILTINHLLFVRIITITQGCLWNESELAASVLDPCLLTTTISRTLSRPDGRPEASLSCSDPLCRSQAQIQEGGAQGATCNRVHTPTHYIACSFSDHPLIDVLLDMPGTGKVEQNVFVPGS